MHKLFTISLVAFLSASFISIEADASLRLPALFSNDMLLQRNVAAKIWGWTDVRENVTVTTSWNGKIYDAVLSADGADGHGIQWSADIQTADAGGPYSIIVASPSDTVIIKNILLGEVWICSGQSNMAMPVRGYTGQPVESSLETVLEAPEYAGKIRIFNVAKDSSHVLKHDCTGKWQKASSKTVAATSAIAYGFAVRMTNALGIPVGIITSAFGGTKIEAWTPAEALEASLKGVIPESAIAKKMSVRNTGRKKPDQPGSLFNAMIYPLVPFTARGFLWYQGCSNRKDYTHYAEMQAAMVEAWRKSWNDENADMLFAFVTIAPHSYGDSMDDTRAFFVENQLKSLEIIPNSLAVLSEGCGEEDCIHPSRKKEVADRLAWNILAKQYGFSGLPYRWPEPAEIEMKEGLAVVYFDNVKYGLCPTYGEKVEGFEIAGKDRVFHKAEAVVKRDPFRVEVSSSEVESPAAVRYAFRNYVEANLCDIAGNPVPPFRTDDWE